MTTLFLLGIVLIGIFGYSVGAYVTLYKLAPKSTMVRALTFLVTGTLVAFATFFISLVIIWPGV